MGDYEDNITVAVAPARLFAYLADVANLPRYLPRLTDATPLGGDKVAVTAHIDPQGRPEQDVHGEAWVHVISDGTTLEWGAPGPHDYHGRLEVSPGKRDGTSLLTVRLHTDRVEGEEIEVGLAETLHGIQTAVEHEERGTDG